MKLTACAVAMLACFLCLKSAQAAVLYVDASSTNPAPPFMDWSSAATNIQDAIDAASAGDLILVTNGFYQNGGRPRDGMLLTNRVFVDKPLIVQSVNGPAVTTIKGFQVPDTISGTNAVRCVYLGDGALLSGFTVTGGATVPQGVHSGITNLADLNEDQCGGGIFCQSPNAIASNCIVSANIASLGGGGCFSGTLSDCVITNNTAQNGPHVGGGGGTGKSVLQNCVIVGNHGNFGGGANGGSLSNCLVIANNGLCGGGIFGGSAIDCCFSNNVASSKGGGSFETSLQHCTFFGNSTSGDGGGTYNSSVFDCTFISNSAGNNGGGSCNFPGQIPTSYVISNCTYINNSALWTGGGAVGQADFTFSFLFVDVVTRCTFVGNSAGQSGGGAAQFTVQDCIFRTNNAANSGGAESCNIADSLIVGNTANNNGGGAGDSALNNCTVAGNSAGNGGGGLNGGSATNCIIYYNSARSAQLRPQWEA